MYATGRREATMSHERLESAVATLVNLRAISAHGARP